jgi:LysR family transcriptional regulator, hydrogen peroxide-inducible genes activator
MEVHQLRYLVALAQEGSFSRAAERMRVAQPSLSQQIQKLEAEVGQPLFDRLPRGVMLTEAGRKLLPFARRILTELADAQRTVDECRIEPSGTVVVGIIPTIAPYVLRPLLEALADEYPNVAINVLEDVTEALVRRLEGGEIDLAIVSTCRNGPGILREVLVQIFLSVCFCRARGFADFKRPAPRPKFPERWCLCR